MKPLVILDEPSEGVQFENIEKMQKMIDERKKVGTSFLIVEQNLSFAEMIADEYLVMDQGASRFNREKSGYQSRSFNRAFTCLSIWCRVK